MAVKHKLVWGPDQDGMPDWWEQTIGSNASSANQNDDPDGKQVSRLDAHEVYLMRITDTQGNTHTVKIIKD